MIELDGLRAPYLIFLSATLLLYPILPIGCGECFEGSVNIDYVSDGTNENARKPALYGCNKVGILIEAGITTSAVILD